MHPPAYVPWTQYDKRSPGYNPLVGVHPLDHLQRIAAYHAAIEQAEQQNIAMQRLLTHYRNLADKSYHHGYLNGVKTLDVAKRVWEERSRMLDKLQRMSVVERERLEKLGTDESALLSKHASIRQTVEGLLHTSAATAHEIQNLRDRYSQQVAGVTQQYVMEKDENAAKLEAASQATRAALERAASVKASVTKAMAQANYYEGQVAQAESDTNLYRQRAERAAGDAEVVRKDMYQSMHANMDQHERELEAIAARKVASTKSAATAWIMRSKDASAEQLAIAKAKLLEATTDAKVETGVAEAAKSAAEKALETKRELEADLKKKQEDMRFEMELILQARARAQGAAQREQMYEQKITEARAEVEDAAAARKDMQQQANDKVKMVEEAEGKTALAKAQAKAVLKAADQEDRLYRQLLTDMHIKERKSTARLSKARYEASTQMRKRDWALEDAMRMVGKVSEAHNEFLLAKEKFGTQKQEAQEMTDNAEEKKMKAEELLKNVDRLAGLAREAARAAAVRAAASGVASASSPVSFSSGGSFSTGASDGSARLMGGSGSAGLTGGYDSASLGGNDSGARLSGGSGVVMSAGGVASAMRSELPGDPGIHYAPALAASDNGVQKIDIHVIPHSPVFGPGGEEGFMQINRADKGTKKLDDAGVNV